MTNIISGMIDVFVRFAFGEMMSSSEYCIVNENGYDVQWSSFHHGYCDSRGAKELSIIL